MSTAPEPGSWSVALEASTRSATVAIDAAGEIRESALQSERAHASDILPALNRLTDAAGVRPTALQRVAVGTGPGSFTGLRVATALALGLARASRARILGVPSGEALVFRELTVGEEACVLLDARSGELYFAHYRRHAADVEALCAPCIVRPDQLERVLPDGVPILGAPGVARAALLRDSVVERLRTDAVPSAGALLELAQLRFERGIAEDPTSVRPLYLRPFRTTRA